METFLQESLWGFVTPAQNTRETLLNPPVSQSKLPFPEFMTRIFAILAKTGLLGRKRGSRAGSESCSPMVRIIGSGRFSQSLVG